jgi:hypothetical protein
MNHLPQRMEPNFCEDNPFRCTCMREVGYVACPREPKTRPQPTDDDVRAAMAASTQDTVPAWADDVLRSAAYKPKEKEQEPGAWTCNVCGFRGFWSGGPHCDGEKS